MLKAYKWESLVFKIWILPPDGSDAYTGIVLKYLILSHSRASKKERKKTKKEKKKKERKEKKKKEMKEKTQIKRMKLQE